MESQPDHAARSFLTHTKLFELTGGKSQDVVVLRQDTTVELALRTLAANRILSAPIVACSKGSGSSTPRVSANADDITDVLGFVDLRDILASFLKELDMKSIKSMKMLQRLRVLEKKGQAFASKSLKDLKGSGGDGDFLHKGTAESATLREIIHNEFLYPRETKAVHGGSHTAAHVHRLALFNKDGRITNVISQSDIVRFLNEHSDKLGELANQTAEQLGWASKPLIGVQPEQPAIAAMELMVDHGISAVAVMSNDGKLIGNFSVSELRTIMSEHFGSLALPVGEFLALEHGTEYGGYTIQSQQDEEGLDVEVQQSAGVKFAHSRSTRARPHTPGSQVGQALVVVPPSYTLAQILAQLVGNRLHRIYVVGPDDHALGVVTLTDVLRTVVLSDK